MKDELSLAPEEEEEEGEEEVMYSLPSLLLSVWCG